MRTCFSRCPKCERLCEWELVESLISSNQMERQEDEACLNSDAFRSGK